MGTGEKMTLDAMCKTYWETRYVDGWSWREMADGQAGMTDQDRQGMKMMADEIRDAIRTVLETHVKPMLAEAWLAGRGASYEPSTSPAPRTVEIANTYAARVIASLTQEPARDV